MSYVQNYFPPHGTRYNWSHKTLNYSPWVLNFWDHWPAYIRARVEQKDDGTFQWQVEVCDFRNEKRNFTGTVRDDVLACLTAETVCEDQKKLLWLPWMDQASAAGWRPPA